MAYLQPYALTDFNRLTDLLSPVAAIPSVNEAMLTALVNSASRFALTHTGWTSFKYNSITEVQDGKGYHELMTRYFPIVSITSIHDDSQRTYGSDTLVTATDYEIKDNNTSDPIPNAGIIRNLVGNWGDFRSNIQVIYTAGFSKFEISTGVNDQIVVNEGGSDITVTLTEALYNASSLATEVQTELNDHASTSNTYTVTYSTVSHRYKIAVGTGETLTIKWTNTGTRHKELGKLLGYSVTDTDTGAESYVADYPAIGVPEDLVDAVESMVRWRYAELSERRIGMFSASNDDNSTSFDYNNVPVYITELLHPYKEIRM